MPRAEALARQARAARREGGCEADSESLRKEARSVFFRSSPRSWNAARSGREGVLAVGAGFFSRSHYTDDSPFIIEISARSSPERLFR
jgi:hypothetical protein